MGRRHAKKRHVCATRRILTQVFEGIDLCVAYKNAQEAGVSEFLKTYKPAQSASR
jgi:hypothetical protein